MADKLNWHTQGQILILRGTLDHDTLMPLWLHRQRLLDGIRFLDVSGLKHIDSAGMALLLHFYHYQRQRSMLLELTGVTNRLRSLIALYKLQAILPCAPAVKV